MAPNISPSRGTQQLRWVGAAVSSAGTSFGLWAKGHTTATVFIEGRGEEALTAQSDGYFGGLVEGVGPGARYQFALDGSTRMLPDPASRWQPEGPEGVSVVCDATTYCWNDQGWRGVSAPGQVLYELHIGTFTREGTWAAALEQLPLLKNLGITVLQLMPVAEFSGAFGWGYDVVLPFAPSHLYGSPDDVRRFVEAAHQLGLGVILDVVYNHLGGANHFADFSRSYFTERHDGEWGPLLNFDGPGAPAVRNFIIQNAVYWIRDFHFDGLRLDATQAMFDDSATHIIAEIVAAARAAVPDRHLYMTAENQPQDRKLLDPPERFGFGLDALASDDFHHAAHVALTGHNEFYYADYSGTPGEFVAAAKFGYLFQGQRSDIRNKPYGTPALDLQPDQFVHFLQNHDQIANSARGLRMDKLSSPGKVRALTALLLLAPQTPCLFQGQEFGASSPFLYFAGFAGDEARAIHANRIKSLAQFPSVADSAMVDELADPSDPETFRASKLDWAEYELHGTSVALHRDLLAMRRAAFQHQSARRHVDGASISASAFFLRFFAEDDQDDRIVFFNLGADREIRVIADPLVAPPTGNAWQVAWSTEDPRYGGTGRRSTSMSDRWVLPGEAAVVFKGVKAQPR